MSTWFRAVRYYDEVTPVVVSKDSEKYITTMDGRRHSKRSEYENYFPTEEEAIEWLIDYVTRQRDSYSSRLQETEKRLANVLKLRKPDK